MAPALVVIAAVFAYAAGGFALWAGAGWFVALLVLSGSGTVILLGFVLAVALGEERRTVSNHATATDPAH
ncbi:hypothetical protein [Palleronia sp. LCG004]|uniref:hypothetical protein n=1 Tax=Palleronia sp. LCG004 TaxID=3079304 RepID=UPI002943D8DB|nr:hypothetical protein [Palleronia sp. LCG004]WOI58391.1 hypothetical protein RVY76_18590 [Palleronia sp. LCG004]